MSSSHQFADATAAQVRGLSSPDYKLVIRQGPEHAKVAIGKEKDRKPIDPPPIVQLKVNPQASDQSQNFLQSPYFFMSVNLLKGNERDTEPIALANGNVNTSLAGTLVSSLHRLKDVDGTDGGFFVFADLSVKIEGIYRLQFNLYEMRPASTTSEETPLHTDNPLTQALLSQQMECCRLTSVVSDEFQVHVAKNWPGMAESTVLTRSFSDQGVRLRLRKEPRALLRKRGPACDDYLPVRYRNNKIGRAAEDNSREDHEADSPRAALHRAERADSGMGIRNEESPFQNSQHSHLSRQSSNPNLMQRFDAPHTSPVPKYENQADGGSMSVAYHPAPAGRMPSLPSSHQDNSNVSPLSTTAVTRAEDYGRYQRTSENILRQTSSESSLLSQAQSHASSAVPFSLPANYNHSLPSSNRTSISEYAGAYTHQPASQPYTNYSQHNHSLSNSSLLSQSPATTRSTPQSSISFSFNSGPRDPHTGMSSSLTSPFESPESARKDYNWAPDRADERASLSARRDPINNGGIFSAPTHTPLYNQRTNSASYAYNPERVSPQGLGITNVYPPSAGYIPTPGYVPSMASGTGTPMGGEQGRSSSAPDALALSSTTAAETGFYK